MIYDRKGMALTGRMQTTGAGMNFAAVDDLRDVQMSACGVMA
ncbi:MAG TPA: hypothetical protein VFY05_05470 [Candidatus Angelobacter sp.]|nr:hypothetical protein [Candidatus Angelobacter sp.]